MKIQLIDPERDDRVMNGAVTDDERGWVRACIDAAWTYLNYTGAGSITVRSNERPASDDGSYVRIATVSLVIHDDETEADHAA